MNKTISFRANSEVVNALNRLQQKYSLLVRGNQYYIDGMASDIIKKCILYCDKYINLSNDENFAKFYSNKYFVTSIYYPEYKNRKITLYDKSKCNTLLECITPAEVIRNEE